MISTPNSKQTRYFLLQYTYPLRNIEDSAACMDTLNQYHIPFTITTNCNYCIIQGLYTLEYTNDETLNDIYRLCNKLTESDPTFCYRSYSTKPDYRNPELII